MKKIISLLLMMSFILAGCSSSKSADTMKVLTPNGATALSLVGVYEEITKNGDLKSIKSGDKVIEGNMVQDDTTVYFKFENTPVYDLPSAGGAGIFWYTVGGTLLMCLAGLLTLYKNKRKRGVGLSK